MAMACRHHPLLASDDRQVSVIFKNRNLPDARITITAGTVGDLKNEAMQVPWIRALTRRMPGQQWQLLFHGDTVDDDRSIWKFAAAAENRTITITFQFRVRDRRPNDPTGEALVGPCPDCSKPIAAVCRHPLSAEGKSGYCNKGAATCRFCHTHKPLSVDDWLPYEVEREDDGAGSSTAAPACSETWSFLSEPGQEDTETSTWSFSEHGQEDVEAFTLNFNSEHRQEEAEAACGLNAERSAVLDCAGVCKKFTPADLEGLRVQPKWFENRYQVAVFTKLTFLDVEEIGPHESKPGAKSRSLSAPPRRSPGQAALEV